MIPAFRDWCRANGRAAPFVQREPLFTPTDKRPGDRVLGAGGKWEVVA